MRPIQQFRYCLEESERISRQEFIDNITSILMSPFIERFKDDHTRLEQCTQLVNNYMASIREITGNVARHSRKKHREECSSYCILQIDFYYDQVVIFCRDFGPGIPPDQWPSLKNRNSGLGLLNPINESVDYAELIKVDVGTCLKIVKHIPQDLIPFKELYKKLQVKKCKNNCQYSNDCLLT